MWRLTGFMPILTLDIPDHAPLETVQNEAIRQWFAFHIEYGDSQIGLAERLQIPYRQLRHFMQKLDVTMPQLLQLKNPLDYIRNDATSTAPDLVPDTPITEPCQFCGSLTDVHLHHVVNRYESPVMVALCSKCHRKFHFLNKLYRPPLKVRRAQPILDNAKVT